AACARAALTHPWLLRAEIRLLHSWSEPVPDKQVPKTGFERIEACPVEVENAADEHWGSRIPFTTPELSICKQQSRLGRVRYAHELVEAGEVRLQREPSLLRVLLRDGADQV